MNTQVIFFSAIKDILASIKALPHDRLLFIIDVNIFSLYKEEFSSLFESLNGKALIYKGISGESLKTIDEYEKCVNYFLKAGVHRKSHLISIGGGATSDFSGFVASTILRGISWSVLPTSLLSMVDASIGGKVGLNLESGKNLVGAFHMPEEVWICPKFMNTLSGEEVKSAKGEILKYTFLDKKISNYLLSKEYKFSQLIKICAEYKQEVVLKDFKELNLRKTLNLGHSFGHAIEKHYGLPHGISVFLGMLVVFTVFDDQSSINSLKLYCAAIGFEDVEIPWGKQNFPLEDIFMYMNKDKKIQKNGHIELIIMENQAATIKEVSFEQLKLMIERKSSELREIKI